MPGAIKATTVQTNGNGKPKRVKVESNANDEEDALKKKRVVKGKGKKPPKKKLKEEGSSDDDDKPLLAAKSSVQHTHGAGEIDAGISSNDDKPTSKTFSKSRVKKLKKEDASGSDGPKPKKKTTKATKDEATGSVTKGKGKKKKEEEEEEEIFRWWEADPNGDGSAKWQTLEHNGVIFPPPYETLPSDVKMKYNGLPCLYSCRGLSLTLPPPQAKRSNFLLQRRKWLAFMLPCWKPTTPRMQHSTRISSKIGKLS